MMTQAEIDQLPNPGFRPIRDMALCKRLTKTASGLIHLPDEFEEKSQVCRVLATGPGLMLDSGIIRECPVKRGEKIFTTPADGFRIVLNGEVFWVFEAMEVVGVITDEDTTAYSNDHCGNL